MNTCIKFSRISNTIHRYCLSIETHTHIHTHKYFSNSNKKNEKKKTHIFHLVNKPKPITNRSTKCVNVYFYRTYIRTFVSL